MQDRGGLRPVCLGHGRSCLKTLILPRLFETGSSYVDKAGLKTEGTFWPLPTSYWNCWHLQVLTSSAMQPDPGELLGEVRVLTQPCGDKWVLRKGSNYDMSGKLYLV